MPTPTTSLNDILTSSELHAEAASRIASALAGPPVVGSTSVEASAVASPLAASPTPEVASGVPNAVAGAAVSSELAGAFASGVLGRLGLSVASDQPAFIAAVASRVSSALRGMKEFASEPAVASSLAAYVASGIGARLVASPAIGGLLASRLAEVATAGPGDPLSRRSTLDD